MNCPSGEIFSPLISTSPKNKFRSMIGGCSARTVSGATRIASVDAKRTSLFIFRSPTTTAILLIAPSFLTRYAEPRILYLLDVEGGRECWFRWLRGRATPDSCDWLR